MRSLIDMSGWPFSLLVGSLERVATDDVWNGSVAAELLLFDRSWRGQAEENSAVICPATLLVCAGVLLPAPRVLSVIVDRV